MYFTASMKGPIPSAIGYLTGLVALNLDSSGWTGRIPSALGRLTQLQYLSLNYAAFTGTVPASLSSLVKLKHLGLELNRISGNLPGWIGGLTQLTFLDVQYTTLTGTLPSSLGQVGAPLPCAWTSRLPADPPIARSSRTCISCSWAKTGRPEATHPRGASSLARFRLPWAC